MASATMATRAQAGPGRSRAQDVDRHVGARMRERRVMLGLTQQQMAELIGVTYQQAHKYEKGINRVAAGRLFTIAEALGVEVGFFFAGMEPGQGFRATPQQRLLLELARNFVSLPSRRHQEALCGLARALAGAGEAIETGAPEAANIHTPEAVITPAANPASPLPEAREGSPATERGI